MTWDDRLIFEISSADPDSASPVWVDFTSRIREAYGIPELVTGRANDLDQIEPSRFTAVLDNSDSALSFGNTLSPYAAWWGPGRKCRLREIVTSAVTQDRLTGYLQVPDELVVTEGIEARVQITVIDRLGRLQNGQRFVSTLGAQILGSGVVGLQAYYPLTDAAGPAANYAPLTQPALPARSTQGFSNGGPSTLAFASVPGPPGDDQSYPLWTPHLNSVNSVDSSIGLNGDSTSLLLTNAPAISGTQCLAIVAWANLNADSIAVNDPLVFNLSDNNTLINIRRHNGVGGNWRLEMTFDFVNVLELDHPANVATDRWTQVAAVIRLSPNSQELWVDGVLASSAVGGSPPGSMSWRLLQIGVPWDGSLAHVQVYVLDAAVDFAAFLAAQRQVGLYGLEGQLTGSRVTTIATYAGVPASDLTQVDVGRSVMSIAKLAGKDPYTALREAERTEQGLLYVDGSGNIVFAHRTRLYAA